MTLPDDAATLPTVPAATALPDAAPNFTSALPMAGVVASGAETATVQSSVAFCVQVSATVCNVPLAS